MGGSVSFVIANEAVLRSPLVGVRHTISVDQIDGLEVVTKSGGYDYLSEKHSRFLRERGGDDYNDVKPLKKLCSHRFDETLD